MKKQILAVSLSALAFAGLASCGTPATATATPMEREVVSAALLVNPGAQASYRQAMKKASPVNFDPNDATASLKSFDSLALESYNVETKTLVSDKEAYAHKDEIVYTLPDGSKESIFLYYADPTEKTYTVTATEDDDEEESKKLHTGGFRSGAFKELLESDMDIDDFDDEGSEISGKWKSGVAVISDTEYQFYSEELSVTVTEEDGEVEKSDFSAFGLFREGTYLAVEQFSVVEDTEKETAYAYTSFANNSFERFLLTTDSDDNEARLVYASMTEKVVISRFEKNGKTLYALRVRTSAGLKFVGIYEKVTTKDENGSEVVSYDLYSETETDAPTED